MEIEHIVFGVFLLVSIILVGGMLFGSNYEENKKADFCEEKGGEYPSHSNICYIEKKDKWIEYKIIRTRNKFLLVEIK